MVRVISLLQDALLVRSSPVLQLIQQSTRKVTSLSPNTRPVLPTALVSQHKPLSTLSTDHVIGHVRDHPLYAVQTTCYHSDVQTRRGLALKRSHKLRYMYSHTPLNLFWNMTLYVIITKKETVVKVTREERRPIKSEDTICGSQSVGEWCEKYGV